MSHYDFLDEHLDTFWQKAVGKPLDQSGAAGIVTAHGDKAYGYQSMWERAGIHFYHGMMLYMLTYSKVMDRPKHESGQWVIDQYPHYKEMLPAVKIPYIAIFHVPSATITCQFEDDGLSAKMRLEDIQEDLNDLPEEDRAEYKILRYTCENDPFFQLPDNVTRTTAQTF